MKHAGGRIADLIQRLINGRFGTSADHDHPQAYHRNLQKRGLPRALVITLEGILDEIDAALAHITDQDRADVLAILCDGLIDLAATGQENPELLKSYAIAKAQELLRGKGLTEMIPSATELHLGRS